MSTFRSQNLKYLVDTHGNVLTFSSKGESTYNPETGVASRTSTTYTVKVFYYNYNLGDIDNENVRVGDRRVVMNLVDTSGTPIPEPESGDELSGEGDRVQIVRVSKIMSGSSAVCYICQVRE